MTDYALHHALRSRIAHALYAYLSFILIRFLSSRTSEEPHTLYITSFAFLRSLSYYFQKQATCFIYSTPSATRRCANSFTQNAFRLATAWEHLYDCILRRYLSYVDQSCGPINIIEYLCLHVLPLHRSGGVYHSHSDSCSGLGAVVARSCSIAVLSDGRLLLIWHVT